MEMKTKIYNKNIKYAKSGLVWAFLGALLYSITPMMQTLAAGVEPLVSGAAIALLTIPFILTFFQDFTSALWVLIPNLINGKGKEYGRVLRTKPGRSLVLSSFFGGPIAAAAFTAGVILGGPVYPVAVSAAYPAVGAIMSRIFLKEKINGRGWAGIVLCVAGAVVVSLAPTSVENYPYFYIGILAAVVATIGWALEGVVSCAAMDFVDPELAVGIRYLATSSMIFIVLPFVSNFDFSAYAVLFQAIPTMALVFLAIGGIGGGIGYYYYYKANNACGVARGMSINILYTVFSPILLVIFMGAEITVATIAGIVVLLSGAFLVAGKPSELLSLRDVA